MSLENNLERIATALETIAGYLVSQSANSGGEVAEKKTRTPRGDKQTVQVTGDAPPVQAAPTLVAETLVQPLVTPPPVAAAPVDIVVAPPVPVVQSAPVVQAPTMTAAELNDALVIEYQRLGNNRDAIMEEMGKFGVSSVNDLAVDKYQPLLNAVKARAK